MNIKIASLPNEIQYKILSYTYYPQSPLLCQDIRHFYSSINQLYDQYYDMYILNAEDPLDYNCIIADLLGFMNDYYPTHMGFRESFCNIIRRSFTYCHWSNKRKNNMIPKFIKKLSNVDISSQIQIIWGLLLLEERDYFLNFAIKEDEVLEDGEDIEEDWDF